MTRGAMVATPPAPLRYFVALVFLVYGFAKLNGSQFTILESELDKPMREVAGFWLTWYYFGYSTVYGTVIALAQIVGALLLTFRRTALLGACLLFGIATNIVLVDVVFGVALGGTMMAFVMWVCLLAMLGSYRERLVELFWRSGADPGVPRPRRRAVAWGVRVAMVAFAAGFTYWIAHYNNRLPTPLDGIWEVRAAREGAGTGALPSRVYFEYNRAHMVVFRYPDRWETHHFEVDPADRTIRMWDAWLQKGDLLFEGAYALAGDRLQLTGRFAGAPEETTIELTRVEARRGLAPVPRETGSTPNP